MSNKRKRDEAGKLESNRDFKISGGSNPSNDPAAYNVASRSTQAEPDSDSSHEDSSNKSSSEQGKPGMKRKNKKRRRRKHAGKKEADSSQTVGRSPRKNAPFPLIDVV